MSTAGILAAVDWYPDPYDTQECPGIFDRLGDRSLLSRSFAVLWDAGCRPIVVAAPRGLVTEVKAELGDSAAIVEATSNRRTTILGALATIATKRVVLHEFRYPLTTIEDVRAVAAGLDDADACLGVAPVKETLKLVGEGSIVETLDRSAMWQQMMPCAFRVPALLLAHQRAGNSEDGFAADVQAIQLSGGRVVIAPVSMQNIRITNRSDMNLARDLLGGEG